MVIIPRIPWLRLLKDLRIPFLFITLYMGAISYFDLYEHIFHFTIPLGLISVPGTVIGLLVAFRTNSAYDRWWEARIIWGAIVNDSRSFVRQITSFTNYDKHPNEQIREMALRQSAWCYCLSSSLRNKDPFEHIKSLISDGEIKNLKNSQNVPNDLLQIQSQMLHDLKEKNLINQFQHVQIDSTIARLTDHMGKCERIKKTVFPVMYSLLVDLLIYMFILFLPFSLLDPLGYALIPTTISLSLAFLSVDRISFYLQDPFENQPSDTPMLALSRTIEINIRQQLKENVLPDKIEPKNGVLM